MKKVLIFLISFLLFPTSYYALNNAEVDAIVATSDYYLRVKNNDELKSVYDDILFNKKAGEYHLYFSDEDQVNPDNLINYVMMNYLSVKDKNIYKFKEYGLYRPIKYLPEVNGNYILVKKYGNSLNTDKLELINSFADYFVYLYRDETDINKLLAAYNYVIDIKNADTGNLGTYNVYFDRRGNSQSQSVAFQLLMEKFGFESYIVDKPYNYNDSEKTYTTQYTYVIVKFANNWYMIDFSVPGNLLVGSNASEKYEDKDLEFINTRLSETNYPLSNSSYNIDYDSLSKYINAILIRHVSEEEKKKYFNDAKTYINNYDILPQVDSEKKNELYEFTVLFLILGLISLVVYKGVKSN